MKLKFNFKTSMLFSAAGFAALWLLWIISCYSVKNSYIIPSVKDTFSAMGKLMGGGAFWRAFGNTLLRTFLAFLISFVLGVSLAVLAANIKGVRAFLAPVVSVLRTVPTLAVVLLLLIWTSPATAPVVVASLVLFPAVYASALSHLVSAVEKFGAFTRAYQVGAARKIFKLYLPVTAPAVLTEGGASFSLGLKITVSGEVLAATFRSLGGMMQEAQSVYLDTPRLFALTIITVLAGFLLEGACVLVKKLVVRWQA